jgi:ribosomal protein S18 acetylase RimI-like enzyme
LSRDEGLRRQYQAEQQQSRQAQVDAEAKAQRAAAEAQEQQRKEASDEAIHSMDAAILLFADCVPRYVLEHRTARMTASELADAGVSSCAPILVDVRHYAQLSGLGILPADQRRALADQAAAKAIEIARGKALQTLAERPRS